MTSVGYGLKIARKYMGVSTEILQLKGLIVTKLGFFISRLFLLFLLLNANANAGNKLDQIFEPDTIGSNLAYFENITGPARTTFEGRYSITYSYYKVDGCEVTAHISRGKVQAIEIGKLSPKCTFNLNKFLPNAGRGSLPPLHAMRFGEFDALTHEGYYSADCLTACGNASDPNVYEYFKASRADLGIEVQLGVVLVEGDALHASSAWVDEMRKSESAVWVTNRKFACTRKYNAVAQKLFRKVKVTSIAVGYGLSDNDCEP